jgi:hypothetical protein
MIETADLLRMRWRLGARGPEWIDCLGVSLLLLARLGRPIEDPWPRLLRRWEAGEDPAAIIDEPPADGWHRVLPDERSITGDLWILGQEPLGAGVVLDGRLWTATREANVIARPLAWRRAIGVWRA